jgi:hypothetical protein
MAMIPIDGLDKAMVLKALYDYAKTPGPEDFGWTHYRPGDLPIEEARQFLEVGLKVFNYIKGRPVRVDLSGDSFDDVMYDRDNGKGAAQKAIETIKEGKE